MMTESRFRIFFLLIVFAFSHAHLSQAQEDTLKKKTRKIQGFPVAFYTPETNFGFGGLAVRNFRFKDDTTNNRPSSINLGAAYTLNNQFLLYLPFNIISRGDRHRFVGELGAYKYTFFFFGIGNQPGTYKEKKEMYEVSFPRLRFSYYHRVKSHLFLGVKYAVDIFSDLRVADTTLLYKTMPLGFDLGTNAGVGPALLYDSRDSIYYPRSGWYIDMNTTFDGGGFFSDYRYLKTYMDFNRYFSLGKRTVFAANVNYQQAYGNAPFYQLAALGGGRRLRGQFEGEFRDHNCWQTQVEIRQEIGNNFGAVAFLGVGWISPTWTGWRIDSAKPGAGVGVRYKLNKKEHINVRLDIGFANDKILPYVTIGEAF